MEPTIDRTPGTQAGLPRVQRPHPSAVVGSARLLLDALGPAFAATVLVERLGWDLALQALAEIEDATAMAAMFTCMELLAADDFPEGTVAKW